MTVEEFQESLVADLQLLGGGPRRAVDGLRRLGRPGVAARHDPGPRRRSIRRRRWTLTEMKDRLADAIARLPEREKLVVALYYYENLTLREIGEVLGVTESRVSQLHTKAVLRLKSRSAGRLAHRSRLGAPRTPPSEGRFPLSGNEERRQMPHDARKEDPQRGVGRPPGQRQDLAERGAAVRGGRDQPPGLGGRRHHGVGLRRRREGARDVDRLEPGLVQLAGPQDQPDRHARRAELRGRRAGRAARLRGRGVRGQRRDGRRGRHRAPVAARRRSWGCRACSS